MRVLTLLCILSVPLLAQQPQARRLPLSMQQQESYLHDLIQGRASGKSRATISPFVVGGYISQFNHRTECRDSAQLLGNFGFASGTCRELADRRFAAAVTLPDEKDPSAGYVLFLTCDVKFSWNHCLMQEPGQTGSMELEESGKEGQRRFNVVVSAAEKLGDKPLASRFRVTEVWHLQTIAPQ